MESLPMPRSCWQWFCENVMADVEQKVMAKIEDIRTDLDNASCDQTIQCWHFSFTQDSRNYLAYYMVDTIFGFARHGRDQVEGVLDDERFLSFLSFVVKEEHDCFLGAQNKGEYFSSLSNRMLRLSNLVDFQRDPEGNDPEVLPDDTIPADHVDDLFEFYGRPEKTPESERPSLDDTFEVLQERMERAKKANENPAQLDLTIIEMKKETYVILRRYEKRMEKVSASVKAITQQMLQNPEEGECQVVALFDRHIFFITPPASKKVVTTFLALQKDLAKKYESKDEADAEACRKCSDFVPLVKEVTCMPDSLLNHLDDCLQRYGKQEEQFEEGTEESEATETDTEEMETSEKSGEEKEEASSGSKAKSPGKDQEKAEAEKPEQKTGESKELKPEEPESKTESKEPSSKQPGVKEASEPKPDTTAKSPEKKDEAAEPTAQEGSPDTADDDRSPTKVMKESEEYFKKITDLETAFEHSAGRCIFSVKSAGTVDYFCPLLGYLPLLPVLKVLCAKPGPNGA